MSISGGQNPSIYFRDLEAAGADAKINGVPHSKSANNGMHIGGESS
jgi:hypothetical protein